MEIDSSSSADVSAPVLVVPLTAQTLRIGRASENDVVLPDLLVSRFHAEIRPLSDGGYELVDLDSHTGSYVNGRCVSQTRLADADTVGVGHSTFQLSDGVLHEIVGAGPVPFSVEGLTVRVADGRAVLEDVSFPVGERFLLAVVGPSGCGKSTLLRALTGSQPVASGTVRYSDRDLFRDYQELKHRIGLVPQEDILHTQLSVRRGLRYAAELRFPADIGARERDRRVEEVIGELGLTDHADTPVGALSGGQRKRVSVALELLTRPSLLFLDEPTSGLDPGLDKSVMEMMRDLADDGHTVIVVTHSVANLDICDRLLVLCPTGTVAYYGPAGEALGYFEQPGWAEVFQRFDREVGRDWGAEFRASPLYGRYVCRRTEPAAALSASVPRPGSAPSAECSAEAVSVGSGSAGHELPVHELPVHELPVHELPVHELPGNEPARSKPRESEPGRSEPGRSPGEDRSGKRSSPLGKPQPEEPQREKPQPGKPRPAKDRHGKGLPSASEQAHAARQAARVAGGAVSRLALPHHHRRGLAAQFRTLCLRYLAVIVADRHYLALLAGLPLAMGMLVRAVPAPHGLTGPSGTNGEAQELLLVMIIAGCFTGAANAVRELVKEKPIYRRERASGLSPGVYLLSKLVVLSIITLVQTAFLVAVGLAGRSMPNSGSLLVHAPILELFMAVAVPAVTSVAIGLAISALVNTAEKTMPLLVLLAMAQVVLSGALVPLQGRLGLEQAAWLSPSRWGLAAAASTTDLMRIEPRGSAPDALWTHSAVVWVSDMGAVLALGAFFVIVAWAALRGQDPAVERSAALRSMRAPLERVLAAHSSKLRLPRPVRPAPVTGPTSGTAARRHDTSRLR